MAVYRKKQQEVLHGLLLADFMYLLRIRFDITEKKNNKKQKNLLSCIHSPFMLRRKYRLWLNPLFSTCISQQLAKSVDPYESHGI